MRICNLKRQNEVYDTGLYVETLTPAGEYLIIPRSHINGKTFLDLASYVIHLPTNTIRVSHSMGYLNAKPGEQICWILQRYELPKEELESIYQYINENMQPAT
jgi:hypothetical protein